MRDRTAHKRPRLAIAAIAALGLAGCSSADGGSGTGSGGSSSGPVGPNGSADISGTTSPAVQLVDVARGTDLVADASVVVVDVRTAAEFAEGHLDRADLIDLSAPEFRDQLADLDRSATYLVYCRSGNRSAQAAAIMAELGFESVYDLEGGILAWQDAGAPVVK